MSYRRGGRGGRRFGGSDLGHAFGRLSLGGGGGHHARADALEIPALTVLCERRFQRDDGPSEWDGGAAGQPGSYANVEPIPNQFRDAKSYLTQLQSHTELEFRQAVRQAERQADRQQGEGDWMPYHSLGDREPMSVKGADFESDAWSYHVLQIEGCRQIHLGVYAKPAPRGLEDKPVGHLVWWSPSCQCHLGSQGRVRSLGYIGSYMVEYASAQALKTSHSPLLDEVALLRGPVSPAAALHPCGSLPPAGVPANGEQEAAVLGARGGLTLIHGPPGTGKSTTIFHLINARVGGQALVACTRNQAVDAVVGKVAELEGGVLVFGNAKRLGATARRFTLEERVKADPETLWWKGRVEKWTTLQNQTNSVLGGRFPGLRKLLAGATRDNREARRRWADAAGYALSLAGEALARSGRGRSVRVLQALQRRLLRPLLDRLYSFEASVRVVVERRILATSKVYLCTIDSTPGMMATMREKAVSVTLDTVVVDEAACVLEMSMPVLLRWAPKNLVLIGDHLQLQPFSHVDDRDHPRSHHTRSLMERAVAAGYKPFPLTIQYRMHPDICEVVSRCFYEGALETAPSTARARRSREPITWVECAAEETAHPKRGYSNPEEAHALVDEVERVLMEAAEGSSSYVITFYNKQRRAIELELEERGLDAVVPVLSVDSCQGSEADYVFISPVRSSFNPYNFGKFFNDPRRVNVALSRAREACIIVGNSRAVGCDRNASFWQEVVRAYKKR